MVKKLDCEFPKIQCFHIKFGTNSVYMYVCVCVCVYRNIRN
jgi:hypothetical protein